MKKLSIDEISKPKKDPLFKGFPADMKTVEMYDKVEKALAKCMFSDHKHDNIKQFANCKRCGAKRERRKSLIKEFGFKSTEQYLQWKKIMTIIKNKKDFRVI